MELRAKERKEKRDQLDKIYEEKKKKAEEEKRQVELRKEEDKRKKIQEEREIKIQKKKEEAKRLEQIQKEQDILEAKINNAREYYKRGLMIKYVILPLTRIVEMRKAKEQKAEEFRIRWQQKNGLRYLKLGVYLQKMDEQMRLESMMNDEKHFSEYQILTRALRAWTVYLKGSKKENRELELKYKNNLKK